MDSQKHVFLSYRSLERDFALALAADLKNAGLRLWMDVLDVGIKIGDDWVLELQNAIDNCVGMIAILSPDYVASKYCRRELKRADTLGRPIFPVLLRELSTPTDWPFEIQEKQYVDFIGWREETVYQKQFASLLTTLRGYFADQIGAEPDLETRYLTRLIADLESRRGVMEYVQLAAEMETQASFRPKPLVDDECGYALMIEQSQELSTITNKFPLRDINEALTQFPKVVLLGDPGAGKTTTIRRLALESARKRLENRLAPFPVVLSLSQWETGLTPLEFIRTKWIFSTDPIEALRSGDISLYLDGLNEMGVDSENRAKELARWLGTLDDRARIVITCRTSDYVRGLKLSSLPTVGVQPLDEKQIRRFASNYLKEKAADFVERVILKDATTSLFQLAQNPYMLGALTYLYENSPNGRLPRNNGTLFQALARALWERERQRQTVGWIPFEQAEIVFGYLAFQMIDERKPTDVGLDYVVEKIGGHQLIYVGASASFVQIESNHVRFCHQLMQEYFAAAYMEHTSLAQFLQHPRFELGGRVPSKWDQTIIALCGTSSRRETIVDQISRVDPILAAKCVGSGVIVTPKTRENLVVRLTELLTYNDDSWSARASALRALETVGSEDQVELITSLLDDPVYYVRQSAARALRSLDNSSLRRSQLTRDAGVLPGQLLGPYKLGEIVGKGGLATVYHARRRNLPQDLALKVFHPSVLKHYAYHKNFLAAITKFADISHPNIVPIYDYDKAQGQYLVMPFMKGNLGDKLHEHFVSNSVFSINNIKKWIKEIADALESLHNNGIVHGNLVTSDILFDEKDSAYLAGDFWMSEVYATTTGSPYFHPNYLAPEQVPSAQSFGELIQTVEISPATDQYRVALLAYILITQLWPFDASTPAVILLRILNDTIPQVNWFRPDVPEAVQNVIEKALAKDPASRYASMGQFAQAFVQALEI